MLSRYYHTLKHLKFIQVKERIKRKFVRPTPDLRPPPPIRQRRGQWVTHAWRAPSMMSPTIYRFLNEEQLLEFPQAWNAPSLSKLWLYNLHYFEDLTAQNARGRKRWHEELIERWIADNPVGHGNGWEAYPLSLRIVNWIKWSLDGNDLSRTATESLAVQVRYLSRSLEFHLLGNHLFENAKALTIAGLYFDGAEAEGWLSLGIYLLNEQVKEQILPDGGHFELSPMYHSLIFEGLLDVLNTHRAYSQQMPAELLSPLRGMLAWFQAMCHPDGQISFFNDAAFAIGPDLAASTAYAQALGIDASSTTGTRMLEDSGYVRLERSSAVLIADVAKVGPDYLPGHAHADTLSFEFSLMGRRVIVNSGTSLYGQTEERHRQRGTSSHNTIRLDKCDSSEVWGGFRVARRASVTVKAFSMHSDGKLQASHDGYVRLAGKPVHTRGFMLREDHLIIEDELEGTGNHLIESFLHFHPDIRVSAMDGIEFRADLPGHPMPLFIVGDRGLAWSVEPGNWFPEFGKSLPNQKLVGRAYSDLPAKFAIQLRWEL